MEPRMEILKIDEQIYKMVEQNPALADRYKELMGEDLGAVIILPRAPTPEDWAAAERLARQRAR
jgi:hypothetical protein